MIFALRCVCRLAIALWIALAPVAEASVIPGSIASTDRVRALRDNTWRLELGSIQPRSADPLGPNFTRTQRPGRLARQPAPLAAGDVQTITLQVVPATLIANSGATALIAATAFDLTDTPVSGVVLAGTITPSTMGTLTGLGVTDANGQVAGTWQAGTQVGTGAISVGDGTVTATLGITLTSGAYVRLSIENAPAGTGQAITNTTLTIYDTLTAYAVGYDVYNNVTGPRTANWGATGVIGGRLSPTVGMSTTFTPAPIISGTGSITDTSGSITNTTGLITVQAPLLQISKSGSPDPVMPNGQLQYTIVYTNAGNATAQNVSITETYPISTSYLAASPLPTNGNNGWSIGSLPPGASGMINVYVKVASQMPVGSALTNTVSIGGAQTDTASYTTTTTVNASPDVSVSVLDSTDPVRVGDLLIYTIHYRNDGTAPVTGVRITEAYPSQVTFLSANPPPDIGNNVWLTNTLGGFGQSRFIFVTVRVDTLVDDLTILNTQVTIDTNETAPFTASQSTQVIAPRLTLKKDVNSIAPDADSVLTYTLSYSNTGSSFASNVIVTDAVPINTSYMSCAPIGCTLSNGIVTWNLGQVPGHTSGVLTLTTSVNDNLPNGTLIANTAHMAASESISAAAAITSTVNSAPDVALSNTNGVATVAAGDTLTYTVAYTNAGHAPAQSVVITDQIPSNSVFVGSTPACSPIGGVCTFVIGTLTAGTSGQIRLTAKVNPTLPAGLQLITSTASISTGTAGDDPGNNLAMDADPLSTVPTFALDVAFDATTPYPGKIVTHTLRYTNTSAMDTTGVVISVTRSPYVTRLSPDDVFDVGNLAAGASGMVTYVVRLPINYTTVMTSFLNVFTIHDDGPGGLPIATRIDTAMVGVPDLVIENVTFSPGAVLPGKKFTATVILRNQGTGTACNPNAVPCRRFAVDAFISPAVPPPSVGFNGYGEAFAYVAPLAAGQKIRVKIANLVFAANQRPILYFKVDNWDCVVGDPCLPSHSSGGLVPEYDEKNNVAGPITVPRFSTYLPYVRR